MNDLKSMFSRREFLFGLSCTNITSTASFGDALPSPSRISSNKTPFFDIRNINRYNYSVFHIGDVHDDLSLTNSQIQIIQELDRTRDSISVCIECLPYTAQYIIDSYLIGDIDTRDFIVRSGLREYWGYNIEASLQLIELCKSLGIGCYASGSPKNDIANAMLEPLNSERSMALMQVGLTVPPNDAYVKLFLSLLSKTIHNKLSDEKIVQFLRAQLLKERVFAQVILTQLIGGSRTIISIVGANHLLYGLGVQRQIRSQISVSDVTILPKRFDTGVYVLGSPISEYLY